MSRALGGALLGLLAGACSGDDPTMGSGGGNAEAESEIFASSPGLWRTPFEASVTPVSVCFENASAYPNEVAWVIDAVEDTWDAASGIDFTGWKACGSAAVRVRIQDGRARVEGGLGQVNDKVYLNFTFNNWRQWCKSSPQQVQNCIRDLAIHEFGHVLGFAHEQNRGDSDCDAEEQGNDGDFLLRADSESVMSYCAGERVTLSAGDIDGAKRIYGWVPVTAGQYGLQHHVGYLNFFPPANRAPETIGVYSGLGTFALGTNGGGSTVQYEGQVTIFNNGRYFAAIPVWQNSTEVRLGSQTAVFAWRIEPAPKSFYKPTVDTREPVMLSTTAGGVKRYLAGRLNRGAQELFLATSPSAATEWRFIGPINKN